MRPSLFRALCVGLLTLIASQSASAQTPLGTEFTYQGSLALSGSPVNGTADFQFKLFGAATGGSQIGSTVPVNNVTVTAGAFTVGLDFGASAFTGDKRWLEITVRSPAGSGAFVLLSPRQPLTAAPYALKARGVDGFSLDASDGSPTDALFVGDTGNVGLGTTAPAARLHIKGANEGIRLEGLAPGAASGAFIRFSDSDGTDLGYVGDGRSGDTDTYLASYRNDVVIYANAIEGGATIAAKSTGNVGIGTFGPIAGLHVRKESTFPGGTLALEGETHTYMTFFPDGVSAGRKGFLGFPNDASNDMMCKNEFPGGDINLVTSDGGATTVTVLEITGADLAEKFPTSDQVEPGMLVAIDPQNPGQLCLARGAYNRGVAGVVSGANGFSAGAVLGNLPGHEDAPPIALSGRVYVWCDASHGAIGPTDLLTTSGTPGYAMKAADSTRAHGAIIGKAMTSLSEGRGLVLVLVNLQ